MAMSTLTIQIDGKLKAQVQERATVEGLTLTSLIIQFLRGYLDDRFEVQVVPKYKLWNDSKGSVKTKRKKSK